MKIKTILEAQLAEIDRDDYEDRFGRFLDIKWEEDYTSVYDALDGLMSDDDWVDQVQDMLPQDDIEDLKMSNDDVEVFRKMAIDRGGVPSREMLDAINKFSVDVDEFESSEDADSYRDDFNDQLEYERDPYGYHGVSRKDFY